MDLNKLENTIILSSIPIKKLDLDLMPIGSASSCLIRYTGNLIIFTVAHATGDFGNWAIEIDVDFNNDRSKMYQIGQMNFLAKADINIGEIKDIDFSYALIKENIKPMHQFIDGENKEIISIPKRIISTDLESIPDKDNEYGFYGLTRSSLDGYFLTFAPSLEMNMKYVGNQDDFFIFKLNHEYGEHANYKGCSGAPILDNDGKLVALVAKGDKDNDCILGIGLQKYKVAIDIECGNIN